MSPAEAGPASDPPASGPPAAPLIRAVVGGALVTGAILALRGGGLSGLPVLLLTVVLLLAVPVADRLSRRALLVGSLAFGWVVVTWWWPLPVGEGGHGTWFLALLAGGLTAWVMAGDVRTRARRLRPVVRAADLVPFGATLVAVYLLLPWLRVRDDVAAMALLLPGWDNSAHLDMITMLRTHGTTIDALGAAPGGEAWKFTEYPQAFHAAAATVLDLLLPATGTVSVAATVNATAWVVVLATGLLAAGVCALPAFSSRPGAALVATAAVSTAFLLGPGGTTLPAGFPNFFLACVLTACLALVVVSADRAAAPTTLLAVGGLLVGVAHTWVLLVSLALPAAALLLVPWRRERWPRDRRGWVIAGAVVAATLVGGLQALRLLLGLDAGAVLTTAGAIETPDLVPVLTVVGLALALPTAALGVLRRRRAVESRAASADVVLGASAEVGLDDAAPGAMLRAALTGGVVLVGLVVAGLLGAVQVRSGGELTYYFWKYALGVELVAVVVAVIGASALVTVLGPRWPVRRRLVSGAVVVVAAAAVSQAYGFTGVPGLPDPLPATSSGVVQRTLAADRVAAPSPTAAELLSAAAADVPAGSHGVFLGSFADVHPISAQQWYLALTGTWTEEANLRAEALAPPTDEGGAAVGAESVAQRALRVLDEDPDAVVLVAPDQLSAVQDALGEDADRAVGW